MPSPCRPLADGRAHSELAPELTSSALPYRPMLAPSDIQTTALKLVISDDYSLDDHRQEMTLSAHAVLVWNDTRQLATNAMLVL